jgi:zinc/manganese transport system substrate-binding protein
MKAIVIFIVCFSIAVADAASGLAAAERIRVVTSTLDMADLVENVGGERVEVYSVFRGLSDLHFFEPVPSQVMKLTKADALVVVGLDADVWMKPLIDAARNAKIRFGAGGYIDPSDGVLALDAPPGRIDGAMGDVHPYGNPHYWLSPANLKIAARNIRIGLSRVSPADEAYFTANAERFIAEIDRTAPALKEKLTPFAGTGVLQYHSSWNYFCEYFGLEVIESLEPKPGVPPTAKHLDEIVTRARGGRARLLLAEPYYPDKPVDYMRKTAGVIPLRLPIYLGATPGVSSCLGLLEHNVDAIARALAGEPEQERR